MERQVSFHLSSAWQCFIPRWLSAAGSDREHDGEDDLPVAWLSERVRLPEGNDRASSGPFHFLKMFSDQVSPPVLEHLDDFAQSLDQAERIKQCVEFLLNNNICTNILGKLIGAMRTRKVSMRKVLEKKVLEKKVLEKKVQNLKMHPRVVLTARRRH